MHGFILLLSSIAHWTKDQSVSKEIITRLDKIDEILREVSCKNPDWKKVERLLEGFPNSKMHLTSLMQDGEMLKQQPDRWEKERRETMMLLSFLKYVFRFQVKNPGFVSDFDKHIKSFK